MHVIPHAPVQLVIVFLDDLLDADDIVAGWQNMSFLLPEVQGTIKIQGSCQGRSRGKSGKNIYLQS